MEASPATAARGSFFPNLNPDSYIHWSGPDIMSDIDDWCRLGHGVTVSYPPGGTGGHVVTCWGFDYDPNLPSSNRNYYTGLWITDSDDQQVSYPADRRSSPNTIELRPITWDAADGRYEFLSGDWLVVAQALERLPVSYQSELDAAGQLTLRGVAGDGDFEISESSGGVLTVGITRGSNQYYTDFSFADITSIVIKPGHDEENFVTYDVPSLSVPVRYYGGRGADIVDMRRVASGANLEIDTGASEWDQLIIHGTDSPDDIKVNFNSVTVNSELIKFAPDALEYLDIYAGGGGDQIDFQSWNSGKAATIDAGPDTDLIQLPNLGWINGDQDSISIRGDTGSNDTLELTDLSASAQTYTIESGTFDRSEYFPRIKYQNIDRLVLNAGSGGNNVYVNSTSYSSLAVDLRVGEDDKIYVGGGDFDTNIRSHVTLTSCPRELYIEDRDDTVGAQDIYTVSDTQFSKSSGSGLVNYRSTQKIIVNASDLDSKINIEGLPSGTSLIVNGNSGVDTFVVLGRGDEADGGDYDTYIKGPVTLHGGTGNDELEIDDRKDLLDDRYILRRATVDGIAGGHFTKESIDVANVPVLAFTGMASVKLDGNDGDNAIEVDGTPSGTAVTLNGEDGDDAFLVVAAGLNSNVIINGGDSSEARRRPARARQRRGMGLVSTRGTQFRSRGLRRH